MLENEPSPAAPQEVDVEAKGVISKEGVLPMKLDFEGSFTTFRKKQVPIRLIWTDIKYTVGGTGPKSKVILNTISGEANPGEVVALMGPSGAGKTTLLNVLAGRITGNKRGTSLSGVITANNEVIHGGAFRKKVAYVTQDDALFATATAREALEFSARLRLPKTTTEEDRKKIVDDMIDSLGLRKCEHTIVGSELIRGLSGGEKKRVSIGVELVSNPACLFLDEPTSGLDSYSAYVVVQILKAISETGCTTICSIHQPSSEVFNSFDSLVLMGNGNVIYQGLIRSVDGPFSAVGLGAPPRTNIADHVMLLTQTHPLHMLPQDNENRRRYNGELPPAAKDIAENKLRPKSLGSKLSSMASFSNIFNADEKREDAKPNGFVQAGLLSVREFKNLYRDKGSLFGRFGATLFLAVLFACIFMNSADQNDPLYSVNSAFGAFVGMYMSAFFGTAQPALLTFSLERVVFIRERATGTYGTIPYVFAKLLMELPLSFLQVLFVLLVNYWSVGFSGSFFLILLSTWVLALAAASTAYILGSCVESPKTAQELAPVVLVPQMLFMGLFTRIEQIPVWLRWAQYLCAMKYAINLGMLVEFDPSNAINEVNRIEFERLLQYNAVSDGNAWVYAVVIIAIFIGFRIIALIILNEKAKQF